METKAGVSWGETAWSAAADLAERFRRVRSFTTASCEPLEVEDYVAQSMPDASPTKWHLAHTTWFFEQFVLNEHAKGYRPYHDDFAFLFNSYYNAVGERVARPVRGLMTRPSVRAVCGYREHVDQAMTELLDGSVSDRVRALVEIGLHHEQQHQELILTDVKHLLSLNPLRPAYHDLPAATGDPGPGGWIAFDEGVRWLGHDAADPESGYAYDNEGPRHRQFVAAFELADRLVTNREYLRFVEDGGYGRARHWLDEGWSTVRSEGWETPLYWERRDGDWFVFTLSGMQPLDLDEPVCHVSLFEADAYADWAGARLATEAEWETAALQQPLAGRLADTGRFHPAPCAADAPGPARQLIGDAWEWTQSQYRPYPGYRTARGALGEYNGKFMCNQFVLRGGSCATHSTHVRRTYRNFFPPAARWQFAGIRLAKDAS